MYRVKLATDIVLIEPIIVDSLEFINTFCCSLFACQQLGAQQEKIQEDILFKRRHLHWQIYDRL